MTKYRPVKRKTLMQPKNKTKHKGSLRKPLKMVKVMLNHSQKN